VPTMEVQMQTNLSRISRLLPGRVMLGALTAAAIAAASPPAAAQSLWMTRDTDRTVMFEMLRPNIEGVDADFLSAAFFLSGRAVISSSAAVVGEIPYANHKGHQTFVGFPGEIETSANTLGNPYVGIEAHPGSSPIFVELGGRIPLTSDEEFEAVITGAYSDLVRLDAFLPKVVSIVSAINIGETTPSKIAYRLRVSPVLDIPTEGNLDSELFAIYSFLIGYHGTKARVGGGLSGRALVTEGGSNIGERTLSQLDIHADFLSGAVRPGLELHVPLGDVSSSIPVVIGASISWCR
jgi:hypothetical protein